MSTNGGGVAKPAEVPRKPQLTAARPPPLLVPAPPSPPPALPASFDWSFAQHQQPPQHYHLQDHHQQQQLTPPQQHGGQRVLEAPLTRLTVGMWTSRRHRACQLLLLPNQQQLVILCDRRSWSPRPRPSRFSLAGMQLTAQSPFASGHAPYRAAGCVHAFEVPFASIRGLDYSNPLCHEARLVLETHNLRKREFATMECARAYFLEPSHRPQAGPPDTPTPSSLAGAGGEQANGAAQSDALTPSPGGWRGDGGGGDEPLWGASSSTARSNLMSRPGWPSAATAQQPLPPPQQLAAASASQPVPIAGRSEALLAGSGTPSERSSFDSMGSERGGWYWGSPASSSCSGHLGGRQPSAELYGQDCWAEPACAAASGSAQQRQRQGPMLHVGSAPGPGGLSSLLASSPEQRHQAAPGQPALRRTSLPGFGAADADGLHRTASESALQRPGGMHASQHVPPPAAAAAGPDEAGWPAAHAFTTVSRVYAYRTLVLHWRDARLPGMLRPVIQGDEQLLKLYESGLPAWAMYAPQYGLFYRPWLRTLTWILFYAFSAFSFVMGFYDLYKVVPGLQVVMQRLMSSFWLPPTAVLEWLEQHTQIRLSILLTYLFGKSEAFLWVMRRVSGIARAARTALQPVAAALGPPLAMAAQALRLAGGQAWQALAAVVTTVGAVLHAGLAPMATLLLEFWLAIGALLLPLVQAVGGPLASMWGAARSASAGAAAGAAALGGMAKAGRTVAGGASGGAGAAQAVWLYVLPADALEVLRTSAVKVAKAAQAVAKFFLQMCENVVRHRLTLELRAGRAWRRAKAAALAAATAPLRLAAELIKYLIIAARLLLLDRIEAGHRAVQAREAAAAAAAAGNTGGAGGAGAGEEAANAGRGPLQQAVPPGQEREMAAAGTAGCVLAGQPASSKKDN